MDRNPDHPQKSMDCSLDRDTPKRFMQIRSLIPRTDNQHQHGENLTSFDGGN